MLQMSTFLMYLVCDSKTVASQFPVVRLSINTLGLWPCFDPPGAAPDLAGLWP